ncbi:hypothetical protein HY624_04375 [Candidatus Uhrbacteria bacterium]|nr:hypothetical protein [Candidatus Uhrbacteria bacterium]
MTHDAPACIVSGRIERRSVVPPTWWEAGPRGGGQTEEPEGDESRGRFCPAAL